MRFGAWSAGKDSQELGESKGHCSAMWGMESEKRRRVHRREIGRLGRRASYSYRGHLCPQSPDAEFMVLIEHSDIYSARSSEGECLGHQRQPCDERSISTHHM